MPATEDISLSKEPSLVASARRTTSDTTEAQAASAATCNTSATAQQDGSQLLELLAHKKLKPAAGQKPAAWLRKLLHLHLNDASLAGQLPPALCSHSPKVSAVFLYGNALSDVSALSQLRALTMLHLQVCTMMMDLLM